MSVVYKVIHMALPYIQLTLQNSLKHSNSSTVTEIHNSNRLKCANNEMPVHESKEEHVQVLHTLAVVLICQNRAH